MENNLKQHTHHHHHHHHHHRHYHHTITTTTPPSPSSPPPPPHHHHHHTITTTPSPPPHHHHHHHHHHHTTTTTTTIITTTLPSIADKDGATLAALDIGNESHFFIWNGVKVRGEAVQVGESCEPIQLHVTYPTARDGESRHTKNNGRRGEEGQAEVVMGLSKNSTLGELRVS